MPNFGNPDDPPTSTADKLQQLLETLYPDPVDVFEDELAERLGFVWHPNRPLDEWWRRRGRNVSSEWAAGLNPVRMYRRAADTCQVSQQQPAVL